jgi:hypothetical protein
MDAEELGHILAGVGLPTGQDIQHLQAGLLMSVMFPLKPVFEIVRLFGNGWNGPAHELLSWPHSSVKLWRIAALCIIFHRGSDSF